MLLRLVDLEFALLNYVLPLPDRLPACVRCVYVCMCVSLVDSVFLGVCTRVFLIAYLHVCGVCVYACACLLLIRCLWVYVHAP
jgi:hypothetical protein